MNEDNLRFDPDFAAETALRMAVLENLHASTVTVRVAHLRLLLERYASLATPPETIVSAACRLLLHTDGAPWPATMGIVSAPPPARHHNIMHALYTLSGKCVQPDDQGFLTSTGRYVGREEALTIALASGQPMIEHASRHKTQLFSEDLW